MIIGINGYINSGKDTVGKIIQYLTSPLNQKLTSFQEFKTFYGQRRGYESDWQIKKFAGKLKQIASIMTGIPIEKFEDQEFKKTFLGSEWNTNSDFEDFILWGEIGRPMTVREFLQRLGTEAIRDGLHENAWINALFADYKSTHNRTLSADNINGEVDFDDYKYPNWIITDTRFPNEAQAIKDRGGIVIRVHRFQSFFGEDKTSRLKNDYNLHPSEIALNDWPFDYMLENNGSVEELIEKVKTMLEHFKLLS